MTPGKRGDPGGARLRRRIPPGVRGRRDGAGPLLPALVACVLAWAAPLAAQPSRDLSTPDSVRRAWTFAAGYELGRPTGWVQVRENRIDGTRLSFGPALGVHAVSTMGLVFKAPAGSGTIGVMVSGTTLRGSTRLAHPVYFNGATLEGGTTLNTRTEPGDFLRVVVDYEHRLARVGAHGQVAWRAGLDATLLDFRLQGTLDPSSAGHETKEDFVTQELPVPFVGVGLDLPVSGRVAFHVGADGGWLPWVSSLRYEGGLVMLNQRRLDADAAFDVPLTPHLTLGVGVHTTSFEQNEQSNEDGNRISLASTAGALQLAWAF